MSPEEAVDRYFDMLIKSRFNELFGDPVYNDREWPLKTMEEVAPSKKIKLEPQKENNWLLNLDAIQSKTGRILFKMMVSEDQVKKGSIIPFSEHSILYSKLRPYLNKVVIPKESGFCTTELVPLTPDNSVLSREYFAWMLRSDSFVTAISNSVSGAKMPRVMMDIFWKFNVPLPPMDIQIQFADFIEEIDKIKLVLQRLISRYDELVKSRFVEMFGNIGSNSKQWTTGKISDVISDVRYGTSKPAVPGGRFKYLRMCNITNDGHLDLSDLKEIDLDEDDIEKYVATRGDILFNRTNSGDKVGKTCVFNCDIPMIVAGYIIRVRTNEKMIPDFLSAILNSQYGKSTLMQISKDSVCQSNINARELQNIDIVIPPVDMQREYVDFVEQVDKSKFAVIQSLINLLESHQTGKPEANDK